MIKISVYKREDIKKDDKKPVHVIYDTLPRGGNAVERLLKQYRDFFGKDKYVILGELV